MHQTGIGLSIAGYVECDHRHASGHKYTLGITPRNVVYDLTPGTIYPGNYGGTYLFVLLAENTLHVYLPLTQKK